MANGAGVMDAITTLFNAKGLKKVVWMANGTLQGEEEVFVSLKSSYFNCLVFHFVVLYLPDAHFAYEDVYVLFLFLPNLIWFFN